MGGFINDSYDVRYYLNKSISNASGVSFSMCCSSTESCSSSSWFEMAWCVSLSRTCVERLRSLMRVRCSILISRRVFIIFR